MADELSDELAELQATVRKLAQERVAPRAREIDESEQYPDDLFALFVDAGLTGPDGSTRKGYTVLRQQLPNFLR